MARSVGTGADADVRAVGVLSGMPRATGTARKNQQSARKTGAKERLGWEPRQWARMDGPPRFRYDDDKRKRADMDTNANVRTGPALGLGAGAASTRQRWIIAANGSAQRVTQAIVAGAHGHNGTGSTRAEEHAALEGGGIGPRAARNEYESQGLSRLLPSWQNLGGVHVRGCSLPAPASDTARADGSAVAMEEEQHAASARRAAEPTVAAGAGSTYLDTYRKDRRASRASVNEGATVAGMNAGMNEAELRDEFTSFASALVQGGLPLILVPRDREAHAETFTVEWRAHGRAHLTWGGRLVIKNNCATRVGGKSLELSMHDPSANANSGATRTRGAKGILISTGLGSAKRRDALRKLSATQRKRIAGVESCCFLLGPASCPSMLLLEADSVPRRDCTVRCLRRLMHVLGAAPSPQHERMHLARQQQHQIRSILKSTGVGVGPKY